MENNNRADADGERFADQLQQHADDLEPFTKQEVIDALSPEVFNRVHQAAYRLYPVYLQFRHCLNVRMRVIEEQKRLKKATQ
jgi:hypothetical protein